MFQHILLALALQLAVFLLLKNWWAGAAAASAWAISREITQAEYRWIETYGSGVRANMPWWGGLDPKVWGYADPWLDWIVPLLTVVLVALFAQRVGYSRAD
jgi:hypothetical protein